MEARWNEPVGKASVAVLNEIRDMYQSLQSVPQFEEVESEILQEKSLNILLKYDP